MNTAPHVAIVIVNWNNYNETYTCIESVVEQLDYPTFTVILVDNGSTTDASTMIAQKFPSIHLVENEDNLGFAAGNNTGFKYAEQLNPDYYLLLNNDTEILNPSFLTEMVKHAEAHEQVGVVGPLIRLMDGTVQRTIGYFPHIMNSIWHGFLQKPVADGSTEYSAETLSGVCLLIKAEVIKGVGGFDEAFFMYAEEHELQYRVRSASWKVYYLPIESIRHYHGLSAKKVPQKFYIMKRANLIYLLAKHRFMFDAYATIFLHAALHAIRLMCSKEGDLPGLQALVGASLTSMRLGRKNRSKQG